MFKKTITIMLIVALFGLTTLSGCSKDPKPTIPDTSDVEDTVDDVVN